MNCHNIEWFPGDTCLICEHLNTERKHIADTMEKELHQYIQDRKQSAPTVAWVRRMPFIIDRIKRGIY